jgi:hypothetical protein
MTTQASKVSETIRLKAWMEVQEEVRRALIDAEKARIRNRKSFAQRIVALLPFTIVWRTK